MGKRSGLAFWVDGDRKVLTAIRGQSSTRNDYYDGPFDQLADNYVDQVGIAEYMQRAAPALRGRIDKYGYYTDRQADLRVALSNYFVYYSEATLQQFLQRAKASGDPHHYISRSGRPLISPSATPVFPRITPGATPSP